MAASSSFSLSSYHTPPTPTQLPPELQDDDDIDNHQRKSACIVMENVIWDNLDHSITTEGDSSSNAYYYRTAQVFATETAAEKYIIDKKRSKINEHMTLHADSVSLQDFMEDGMMRYFTCFMNPVNHKWSVQLRADCPDDKVAWIHENLVVQGADQHFKRNEWKLIHTILRQ